MFLDPLRSLSEPVLVFDEVTLIFGFSIPVSGTSPVKQSTVLLYRIDFIILCFVSI